MCGIAGILDFGRGSVFDGREALSKMLDSLRHRGPDDRGEELIEGDSGSKLWLGHQRLSIIDLSHRGHQPMANVSKTIWISSNSEIYNFREIRAELKTQFEFNSQSDTEAVLKAYEAWGESCLDRFRGMFSFGIWDGLRKRLFLARDRLGVKPLYYFFDKKFFLFASEIRALIHSGLISVQLSSQGVFDFLAFGRLQGPGCVLEGIRELKPGHSLSVGANGHVHSPAKYWNPFSGGHFRGSEYELQDRIRENLLEAVRYRLVSDVPVGTFLSGGIDSSSLTCLLSHLTKNAVKTLSIIFQEKKFDESFFSSEVAKRYGTDHQAILVGQDDLLKALAPAISAMDQPTIDGINTYFISRFARDSGLKVVLSGLGGDELFGGYDSFWTVPKLARLEKILRPLSPKIREIAGAMVRGLSPNSDKASKLGSLIHGRFVGNHVYYLYRALFCYHLLKGLIADSNILETGFQRHLETTHTDSQALKGLDDSQKISWLELSHYMTNMLLRDSDVMSMAHGLELRVPLIDHKLVELLLSVPGRFKLKSGQPKALLTDTLPSKLPESVVFRKKMGFTFPFENWLKTRLRFEMESVLLTPHKALDGILSENSIRKVWVGFLKGQTSWARPWSLYVFKKWVDQNGIS